MESTDYISLYKEAQETLVNNTNRILRVVGDTDKDEIVNLQKGVLSEISGLSKGTITKLTDTSLPEEIKPDLETLCKLGHALNISPAFLLMSSKDWAHLFNAFNTLGTIGQQPNGELAHHSLRASTSNDLSESLSSGIKFIELMFNESLLVDERVRQRRGVLGMTAITQNALRRKGNNLKEQATAIGALIGNREVSNF